MNERIRELAEQAFFDGTTSQPSDKMYTFSNHKMQQFAELIVQECGNIAFEHWALTHDSSPQEVILKHFGIER